MNPIFEQKLNQTRRHFLKYSGLGIGAMALASLEGKASPADPLAPRPSHFPGKAKRVIYLHMAGSPPHLDLFDYRPELVRRTGQNCPDEFLRGRRFAFTSGVPRLLGTPQPFAQRGQSGQWMSAAVPHLHTIADDLCFVKSMF